MGTLADKASKVLDTKRKIAAAIEQMTGKPAGDVFADYPEQILGIQTGGGSGWTGHADVEGLKAIGWTDEDIAYYQQYGVNWNEEDDAFHKVPEDNKALYGVINIGNVQQYKDILVYLPKIDMTGVTSLSSKFDRFYSLVAIPLLDTSKVTNMYSTFSNCCSLVFIPPLDTSSVTTMSYLCQNCYSLLFISPLDASKVTTMSYLLQNCYSLISAALLNTSNAATVYDIFYSCRSLVSITEFDFLNATIETTSFSNCSSLRFCNIRNLKGSVNISATSLLEKSSLLYMIENASSVSSCTIKLSAHCYNKYSSDPDVVAALSVQPLVSLASA